MSQIKIRQVDDDNLIVEVGPETPVEAIDRLCKGFADRGLVEDLSKSTVSNRYFFRSKDPVVDLADELIKSLSELTGLTKANAQVKAQFEVQARNRLATRNASRAKSGFAPISLDQMNNPTGQKAPSATTKPSMPRSSGPATLPGVPNQLVGEIGANAKKSEYPGYSQTDPKLKRKQPVKKWTPEEIANENKKRGLKKNAWGQHLDFPNGDEMVKRYQPGEYETNEDRYANDLANLMANKSLLGMQPPPQPTDQQMFGHLVASEEQIKKSEQEWGGAINNWLVEATKPISSRFSSEEEEMAYWNSIGKVSDAPDGTSDR